MLMSLATDIIPTFVAAARVSVTREPDCRIKVTIKDLNDPPCTVGMVLTDVGCVNLPCELGPWERVSDGSDDASSVPSMNTDLPTFITSATINTQVSDWEELPSAGCYACDGQIVMHRDITRWNGSPECSCAISPLDSVEDCNYPCPIDKLWWGTTAAQYLYGAFQKGDWLANVFNDTLGTTSTKYWPEPTEEMWNSFYIQLAECDETSIEKAREMVYSLLQDVLPTMDGLNVRIVPEDESPCTLLIVVDDDKKTYSTGQTAGIAVGVAAATAAAALGLLALLAMMGPGAGTVDYVAL
jgi:hypothetical protein